MIAIAANSPLLGGQFTGWQSTRQRVWSQLDSARCGPILGANGDDPASDWARYALKAPVMLVHTTPEMAAVRHRLGAVRRLGRRPGAARRPQADAGRPRLPPDDAVPAGAAASAGWRSATSTACPTRCGPRWCSPSSRCSTIRSPPTSPPRPPNRSPRRGTAPRRSASATGGCTRPRIRCVQAAAERAPAELEESMQRLVRSVEKGRCPADDFADRAVKYGIGPAVSQLARGEM